MGLTTRQSSDQFGADQAASEPLRRATGRATTCGRQRGGCARRPSRTVERGSGARSIAPGTDREGEGGSVVDSDSAGRLREDYKRQ